MPPAFTTPASLPTFVNRQTLHRPRTTHYCPTMSNDPLFATRCIDKPNSQSLRAENRLAHLQWANNPINNLLFAGPLRESPNDPVHGSLLIMRAPNEHILHQILLEDPYNKAALFQNVSTHKWVMGIASNELPDQLFVVWCLDKPNSTHLRKETRPRHLDWWTCAGRRGIIGPFPCQDGANGTLIVCEGESVAGVSQWAATDPYNQVGLFDTVEICAVQNVVDRISKSKLESP